MEWMRELYCLENMVMAREEFVSSLEESFVGGSDGRRNASLLLNTIPPLSVFVVLVVVFVLNKQKKQESSTIHNRLFVRWATFPTTSGRGVGGR